MFVNSIIAFFEEFNMFNEEIKIKSDDDTNRPRKPPKLLIFGIAIIGGCTLAALLLRVLMYITGAL